MKRVFAVLAFVLMLSGPNVARASSPLVDVAWLLQHSGQENLVVLDLRGPRDYRRGHVPGAVNTSYGRDGWRVRGPRGTPGMFPAGAKPLAALARTIGNLGVANHSHVVLLPYGDSAGDMGVATRIYWTFKVLGHDAVSILDGGMAAYTRQRLADKRTPVNPLETGASMRPAQQFAVALRQDMLVHGDDAAAALARGVPLVDARPNLQFIGLQRSGSVLRAGTLPGAMSLPGQWLTENGGGKFRDQSTLRRLYGIADVPVEGELISFCNTGHWASLNWFVSSELMGNRRVRLYDGSLAEWTRRAGSPLELKVDPGSGG